MGLSHASSVFPGDCLDCLIGAANESTVDLSNAGTGPLSRPDHEMQDRGMWMLERDATNSTCTQGGGAILLRGNGG